jgi:hypothetical protein
MAETLVPEPSSLEVEIAIKKLKRYKSPGIDHIPAELIRIGVNILCSKIQKFTNFIWNKEEFPQQWGIYYCTYGKKDDETDCSNYRKTSMLATTYSILSTILVSRLAPYVDDTMGIINIDFDVIHRLMIRYFVFI